MRISQNEIKETIELFVNSIYDDDNSDWKNASFDDWSQAVYEELIDYGHDYRKFIGKDNIKQMIQPLLTQRLLELKEEGYQIKAI